SPDGQRIAFNRILHDSTVTDLFLRDSTGTIRRLTNAPGDDVLPSWSPDGRHLAFTTTRWTPRGNPDSDIGILDPVTAQARQLTSGPDQDDYPSWSPDGSRIAFIRLAVADGKYRLCWVTVDGSTTRCLEGLPTPSEFVGW